MKLLTVDTIDEAREKITSRIKSRAIKTEAIPLAHAAGRVLAGDIISPCDIPSFRRSTVDGYAVIAADTAGATEAIPALLNQAGSVSMGKAANCTVRSGECAYVPTGGMIPDGADAVVMAEYCEQGTENREHAKGAVVCIYGAAATGAGFVEAGEDMRKGELLLGRGTLLRPQEIGALAAAGITMAQVFVPLAMSIISTGDELVAPEQEPGAGEVRDVNTYALTALAVKHGYAIKSARVLPDDEQRLEAAVTEAMIVSDIVVISGGSSRGEKDITAEIINRAAHPGVFTHGLAVKPGKPTILGWDEKSKTLLTGLPGHPVSAIMVFEQLLGNEQLALNGEHRKSFCIPARVTCNIPGAPGKTVYQPVTLALKDGGYCAEPVFGKSGLITTLTQADGYIIIDMNKEGLKKDEDVMAHLF